MNSSRRPSATKPTFLYMLLVCREKLNLQRGRIIQWDSSSKHTDRLLLFSEIHSSPFSAGAFFLTKEKSNCVFPTDKKWIWVSMQWEICRNFDKISFWWGGKRHQKGYVGPFQVPWLQLPRKGFLCYLFLDTPWSFSLAAMSRAGEGSGIIKATYRLLG